VHYGNASSYEKSSSSSFGPLDPDLRYGFHGSPYAGVSFR